MLTNSELLSFSARSAARFSAPFPVSRVLGASGLRFPGTVLRSQAVLCIVALFPRPPGGGEIQALCSGVSPSAREGKDLPEEKEPGKEVGGGAVRDVRAHPAVLQAPHSLPAPVSASPARGRPLVGTHVPKAGSSVCGSGCIFNKKQSFLGGGRVIGKKRVWFSFQKNDCLFSSTLALLSNIDKHSELGEKTVCIKSLLQVQSLYIHLTLQPPKRRVA